MDAKRNIGRRPGRPKDGTDLRGEILDAAEAIFAESGYVGAKMRDIADLAGTNQSLIRYYFGSKEELFDEVFRRRGDIISGRRHVLLDELLSRSESPSVEDIVRAYLTPQWEMKHSGTSGAAFVRLQARLHAEPEEHSLRLRREVYDASIKRYIDELTKRLTHLTREIVSLRMAFVVGAYMFMLNDLGRLNDLTDGQIGPVEGELMLSHLTAFLSVGLKAPMP